jgi:hypothetical protein
MPTEDDFIREGLKSQGFEFEASESSDEVPAIHFENEDDFTFDTPTEEAEETSVLASQGEETTEGESQETPSDLLNNEQTDQQQSTDTPTETPAVEFNFDNELSQRTDGKFSTWDEVQSALEAPKETAVPKELENLINYFNEGGEDALNNWTKLMSIDPEGMSDTDVHKYKLQEQGYSADEIAYFLYEYEQKHNIHEDDFDLLDRGEQLKLKAEKDKFARQAREYRKEIQAKKDGLKLPERNNQAISEDKSRELEEMQKRWESTVSDNVKDFTKVDIKLPNGSDFEYEVSPEMKKSAVEIMNNPNSYWQRFQDANGKTDLNKLRTELLWGMFGQEILKSAAAQANSNGKEEVAKDINNINFESNGKASDSKKPMSIQEQIMQQMLGNI